MHIAPTPKAGAPVRAGVPREPAVGATVPAAPAAPPPTEQDEGHFDEPAIEAQASRPVAPATGCSAAEFERLNKSMREAATSRWKRDPLRALNKHWPSAGLSPAQVLDLVGCASEPKAKQKLLAELVKRRGPLPVDARIPLGKEELSLLREKLEKVGTRAPGGTEVQGNAACLTFALQGRALSFSQARELLKDIPHTDFEQLLAEVSPALALALEPAAKTAGPADLPFVSELMTVERPEYAGLLEGMRFSVSMIYTAMLEHGAVHSAVLHQLLARSPVQPLSLEEQLLVRQYSLKTLRSVGCQAFIEHAEALARTGHATPELARQLRDDLRDAAHTRGDAPELRMWFKRAMLPVFPEGIEL